LKNSSGLCILQGSVRVDDTKELSIIRSAEDCSTHFLLFSKYLSTFSAFDFPRSVLSSVEEVDLATEAATIEEEATKVAIEVEATEEEATEEVTTEEEVATEATEVMVMVMIEDWAADKATREEATV